MTTNPTTDIPRITRGHRNLVVATAEPFLRDWEAVRRWAGAVGDKLQQGAAQG